MQEVDLKVKQINSDNIPDFRELYENFAEKAYKDYKFELPPLKYDEFIDVVEKNLLRVFLLYEKEAIVGLLIYTTGINEAIELNLIHTIDNENHKIRQEALLTAFLDTVKSNDNWKVISYPMLGIQDSFVRNIPQFGFKLVGQAVVRFKFDDLASIKILQNYILPDMPEGYSMSPWKDEYFEQASQVIHETFKTASDTYFDPRFLSTEGSKDAVHKIVSNTYGDFLPDATTILLHNGNAVGICFANMTNALIANIPLIGINPGHKNKGFGKYLLKNTLFNVIKEITSGRIIAQEINATVETDNYPALRMYRRIGFKEDYTYPHAYLKNPNFKTE